MRYFIEENELKKLLEQIENMPTKQGFLAMWVINNLKKEEIKEEVKKNIEASEEE